MVEDDEAIRETLQLALEMEGYEVLTAVNGRNALDVLRDHHRPDLILLDLMMPVMDGWGFVAELEKFPALTSIPIVVATAFTDATRPIRSAARLQKPIELDALLSVVRQHSDRAGP